MSDYTTIIVDSSSPVATVWLNRPHRGNAFDQVMQAELHQAFTELDDDDAIRAIVVTGKGRFFSTGADLEAGGSTFALDAEAAMNQKRQVMATRTRPWELRTPIIAAMNGSAVGVGLTFPMQWDIRIVAVEAKYGFVFNRRGVMPEANSLWLLPRMIGHSRALELLLTGRIFLGSEAVEMGLALQAYPADEVLPAALALAEDIAANTAPVSVALTKRLAYELLSETDREKAYNEEWELFHWVGTQPDAAEGVSSFLEKREPSWTLPKTVEVPPVTTSWESFRR